jgi:hypothetical protein
MPRFNLRDPWPINRFTADAKNTPYGLPLDVAGYVRLTDYFRGDLPADSLISPYCYRPLIPLLASRIPGDSLTAINLINIASLVLTLVVLEAMLRTIGYETRARTVGLVLFTVSFPVFYYGTIGFVDPPSVLVITLGAFLALRRRYALLGLVTLVGVGIKETNGIVATLPLVHSWAARRSGGLWFTVGYAALAALTVMVIRWASGFPAPGYLWLPSVSSMRDNFSRPRAMLSLALTLGVPGFLALLSVVRGSGRARLGENAYRFLAAGMALGLFLYAYSLTSAYADGRVIWITYPFAIPLGLSVVSTARMSSLDHAE